LSAASIVNRYIAGRPSLKASRAGHPHLAAAKITSLRSMSEAPCPQSQ
jgi:hypothetical protein